MWKCHHCGSQLCECSQPSEDVDSVSKQRDFQSPQSFSSRLWASVDSDTKNKLEAFLEEAFKDWDPSHKDLLGKLNSMTLRQCKDTIRQLCAHTYTLDEVLLIMKNLGVDVECGACAGIGFTGSATEAHTCERKQAGIKSEAKQ